MDDSTATGAVRTADGSASILTTDVLFGVGGDTSVDNVGSLLQRAEQADRAGLDVFSLSDHPYLADRIDAYAAIGVILGRTTRIAGLANVTNLPSRPPAVLARTVTSLASLSQGRIVLGMGAGGLWDRIADLGVPRLTPAAAVEAFEEAITLIRQLAGGGAAVTFTGHYYHVRNIEPAAVAAPPIWTGSVGAKSLAVTGRVADGWIPGHAADWLSERYRAARPIIDEAAAAIGREPGAVRTIYNLPGRITGPSLPATRDDQGRWVGGSVAQWVEELTGAVLEHGAAGFLLFGPNGAAADEVALGRWGNEIAPAVRAAIGRARA